MPLSEKKKASNAKWDRENLKRMSIALPVGDYAGLKEHIERTGESANGFIRRAIKETIAEDASKLQNAPPPADAITGTALQEDGTADARAALLAKLASIK